MKRTQFLAISLYLSLSLLVTLTSQMRFSLTSLPQFATAADDASCQQHVLSEPSAALSTTVTMVFINDGWDATQMALTEQIAAQLSQEITMPVYSLVVACPWAAAEALAVGEADVGWLLAPLYVEANGQYGVDVRLVAQRFGATQYRGQILVNNSSGITTLVDLAGKNFAFTSPDSLSGYSMPAYHILKTQGITYETFFSQTFFASGHSNVAEAVYLEDFLGTTIHGGGMFDDARTMIAGTYSDIFTTTKVVSYTDFIANDAIAIRHGLDPLLAQQIITGLHNLAGTPTGLEPMQLLYDIEDLVPTHDSAYDPLRGLMGSPYAISYPSCAEVGTVTSSSGGTVTHVDLNELITRVEVPGGTTTDTVSLGITSVPAATHLPGHLADIGRIVDVSGIYSNTGQPVTSLTGFYTMTFGYYDSMLDDVIEGGLGIYWWSGSEWTREPSSQVDMNNNQVMATPNHFSLFAVFGLKDNVYLPAIMRQ